MKIKHACKEANSCANRLAKVGMECEIDKEFGGLPDFIVDLVSIDINCLGSSSNFG